MLFPPQKPTFTYERREYQDKLISQIFAAWQTHRSVMLQLPTGGGKTVIFADIARRFAEQGMGVLLLAHREELVLQGQSKLECVTGVPVGIIKAGYPWEPKYDLQAASVQSLVRRKFRPEVGLVIVDEAHHACAKTYTSILEEYPEAYILGCTATPHRIDGQGFKWLFDALICGPSTAELIVQKYLSPFLIFPAIKVVDTSKVKSTGGDFNAKALAKAVDAQVEAEDVINEWRKHADGLRTVVFAVDVPHSKEYAKAFREAGIAAEHLDGKTDKDERRAILQRFETGETTILCNCGIVSEGFDLPAIECAQIVRPTKSLTLWLQMVGRALRTTKSKTHAVIIEHTKNWRTLGLPDEEQEWSLEPVSLAKKEFFYQQCSNCNHAFRPLPHEVKAQKCECPNCKNVILFETGKGVVDAVGATTGRIVEAVTEETKLDLKANPEHKKSIDRLYDLAIQHGYKLVWIYYRFKEDHLTILPSISLGTWRYLAEKLDYKQGWAWITWTKIQDEEALKKKAKPNSSQLHREVGG
jgi:superfamily II DNA or RNA helicase